MPDFRRLEDKIALPHNDWIALILVNNAHPPSTNIEELEGNLVEMHPVFESPSIGDRDLGTNIAPAKPARDQIPVDHPGPAPATVIIRAGDFKARSKSGQIAGRLLSPRTGRDPDPLARTAEDRGVRIVCRVDDIEFETTAAQLIDCRIEILAVDLMRT